MSADLTPGKIRAIRRHLDPHMHIGDEFFRVVCIVPILAVSILATFGVITPISASFVAVLALIITGAWTTDLIMAIQRERRRIAAIRQMIENQEQP